MTSTYLITGANRGIGFELTRQLAELGERVIATARKPEDASELAALGVRLEQLDVCDTESVRALADRLSGEQIDVLVNNAGIVGDNELFEDLDIDACDSFFQVNSLGAMRVTQAMLPNLLNGEERKIVHVTSHLGSLTDNISGGGFPYRMSKAALNMFNKSLSIQLEQDGFVCAVVHPGWAQTRLGGSSATSTAAASADGLVRVIRELSSEDNGAFLDVQGSRLPW